MRTRSFLFGLLTLTCFAITAGCQAPPASTSYVLVSWGVPAATGNWAGCGAGQPTCTYAIYAERITGSTCDAATSTNYHEVTNPSSRPTGTSFEDTGASGLTSCYAGETVQTPSGGTSPLNSGPSNVAGPATAAGVPLAPSLTTTAAANVRPALPMPPEQSPAYHLANRPQPMVLLARVEVVKR